MQTLLAEWDLLQQQVIPSLIDSSDSPARIWSIGRPADAVAMVAAVSHVTGRPPSEAVTMFSSGWEGADDVRFKTADLGCLAAEERRRLFRRQGRYWVPAPMISEHIRVGEPVGAVDLVTVRQRRADGREATSAALGRLREGGRMLVAGPQPGEEDGRLLRKVAGRKATVVAEPRSTLQLKDPTETLAARQRQEELVTAHLGLADSLARRFAHRGESDEELAAVARLALVQAVQRYEEQRGTFAPYAAVCILGELKRHFRDKAWSLRVPRSTQELYLAARQAKDVLAQERGATPTAAEIADYLSVSRENLLETLEAGASFKAESLDSAVSEHGGAYEPGAEDSSYDRALEREQLRELTPTLDQRERTVLTRLFFEERTQSQVAEELGVSQMEVSRSRARALIKLRG